ncbi:MAG: PilZ domain-containing protein [Treponema sp.]|jgi:c-di-GMP-binding flagellar brake protein YcgR|nr:PilZ domain-containing protein [Treponema sp.]
MSTQIKRIEKEYFLSKLAAEQIPVIYIFNRQDYVLKVDKISTKEIEFVAEKPIEGLVENKRINLMFDHKGLSISFSTEIKDITEHVITTTIPETLYKNLARSSQRVAVPTDLRIELKSLEDRYSLPFPKSSSFESLDSSAVPPGIDPKNFNGIVTTMMQEVKQYADGQKIVYYNVAVQPDKTEELIVAESGKILFIPSTREPFPEEFASEKKFITGAVFKRYFESVGVVPTFLDQTLAQFLKTKGDENILSALWIPFLFQEYVVGYIYLWKNNRATDGKADKLPFSEEFAEKIYHYGKCIIFSLERRGYFEAGRMKDRVINGKIADISASGLRFTVPNSFVFQSLQPGVELAVALEAPQRTIDVKMKIRRRYKEGNLVYLGCSFIDITPEDSRFLFEFIYGKPANPAVENLIVGNV